MTGRAIAGIFAGMNTPNNRAANVKAVQELRAQRERLGLSRDALSDMIINPATRRRISFSMLYRWENGWHPPSPVLLERWADNPPRYRFHCRGTLSPGAEPRRFEASGSDPAVVMRQVADAVAECRAKRGQ